MFKDCQQHGSRMMIIHNLPESTIVNDVASNVPKIYVGLDNRKAQHHSHIIEVEGMIKKQPIVTLINSGARHSCIDPNLVERFDLARMHNHSWMVQLATSTKWKIGDLVRDVHQI